MRWAWLSWAVLVACDSTPPRDADGNLITVGTYRIRTYPKGAHVFIDGEHAAHSTPATLILDAGTYRLRIQHPGAKEAFEREITVHAGAKKVLDTRIPSPAPSSIAIRSNVDGAAVRINGYRRGVTPLDAAPIRAGRLRATLTAPDGRVATATATIDYGEVLNLEVNFTDAATAAPSARGLVTLIVEPEGWIEDNQGRRLGTTPLKDLEVPAGRHSFTLRAGEDLRREIDIFVEAGRRTVYRYELGARDRAEKTPASPRAE